MRIQGTLFACFPPRPWCRTKPVARSKLFAACNRLGLLDRIKPQPEICVPWISAGSIGCAEQLPAGSQPSITPAPLQPAAHCLYPCSRRSLPFCSHKRPVSPPAGHGSSCRYAAYDACLRRLRVCAAMHGCTHTVLVSTYSVSVVRHVLPIRIAPKTSSPCCKVAAVDLIGRLCYRQAVTFGAVSRKFS